MKYKVTIKPPEGESFEDEVDAVDPKRAAERACQEHTKVHNVFWDVTVVDSDGVLSYAVEEFPAFNAEEKPL